MSLHIIEYIGASGLIHSKGYAANNRITTPHAGDVVDFGEFAGKYPFIYGQYGRIEGVGVGMAHEDEAHVCCEMGSAFLAEHNGAVSVSISGGPFCCINLDDLEPTLRLHPATFWNWGNNGSGAGRGVEYVIYRPVFKLIRLTKG